MSQYWLGGAAVVAVLMLIARPITAAPDPAVAARDIAQSLGLSAA